MNNRGEKIVSVYWFTILFLVAGAVVYMVAIFYGQPYDIRELEGEMLSNKIADCLVEAGELKSGVLNGGTFSSNYQGNSLLSQCGITFEVEDSLGWKDDQFYLEVAISNYGSPRELSTSFVGNANLKSSITGGYGGNFPVSVERGFYATDQSGTEAYEIKTFVIVRKTEKND
tara:strand:- start:213 stop:728 length:516 start_codon:yes stop_codon:yes gene_type:complete